MSSTQPLSVTVIVPTLNEARHIEALAASVLSTGQEVNTWKGSIDEMIVVDGGSTDGTVEIVEELAKRESRIRLVRNPLRWQSAGMNEAVRNAQPGYDVIVRMDAHADYPQNFVERVVGTLIETGADSVVVRLQTIGRTCFQQAVAAVVNSKIGSGGAVHRVGGPSGFVDHGHHAGFRRSFLEETGGYDEAFQANEDAELDARARAQGKRIWFAGDIELGYFPRSSPTSLFRQYFRYGNGRAQTYLKNREPLHARQIAPSILVVTLCLSFLASLLFPVGFLLPAMYLCALILAGVVLAFRANLPCVAMAPVVLGIIQLSWGCGFLRGLVGATANVSKRNQKTADHRGNRSNPMSHAQG